MEKRKIGSLEVSVAGLGCNNFGWRIGPEETKKVLDAALGAGVNFLDTADMYSTGQSEEYIAAGLGARRKDVVLATKFGFEMGEGKSGASPAYVKAACDASLQRLKTDHIDLYQVHRPDPATPIAETLHALDELVKAGKVREIGCSNFSADQLREAEAISKNNGWARFVSIQNEYSLLKRTAEADVIPTCRELGVTFIPYFPLANGLLSGKYRKGKPLPEGSRGKDAWGPAVFTEQNIDLADRLAEYAESRGHSMLELAISWLACQDTVPSVITGARSVEQATTNAAAAAWKMSPEELAAIGKILTEGA